MAQVLERILAESLSDNQRALQVVQTQFKVGSTDLRFVNQRQLALNSTPALWEAMRLPAGFRMSTRSVQALPGSSEPATHLVFTDGVASVSVFVEPRKPDSKGTEGPTQVGSSSAFSTVVDDHQVTAIGEVPPNTVQFIAEQVKSTSKSTSGQAMSIAPPRRNK